MSFTLNKTVYGQLLAEFQPKIITSEEEYNLALVSAEKLMHCQNRSPEQTAVLQLLVNLIEEYESKHYPMGESSPHEILEYLMEVRGLKESDLVDIIGSKDVVTEIIDGKIKITKNQAETLGEFFHVSPELFISL